MSNPSAAAASTSVSSLAPLEAESSKVSSARSYWRLAFFILEIQLGSVLGQEFDDWLLHSQDRAMKWGQAQRLGPVIGFGPMLQEELGHGRMVAGLV